MPVGRHRLASRGATAEPSCVTLICSMAEQLPMTAKGESANDHTDSDRLAVLRLLAKQPQLSQRELSGALGVSLGKTHYILHALLDKGLLKVRNFRRSDNSARLERKVTHDAQLP
jgi:DNA-binding MarR family transcriptional regulator